MKAIKMRQALTNTILILLFVMYGYADDIDLEVHSGLMTKMLREMSNNTNAAESLNLPANATSIRENITDTFSCENRTYGYYADVDNECQVFHVCLPSETPSGRNITYKWSFICPSETIFNQEVLVCTRPRDSIPCEDSPSYYDLNMEIGKIAPKEETKRIDEKLNRNQIQASERDRNNNERDRNDRNQIQKRRPDNRKQNIVFDKLFKDIVDEEMKEKLQDIDFGGKFEEIFPDVITDDVPEDNVPAPSENKEEIAVADEDVYGRLALERSVDSVNSNKRSFRFRSDA